jgi:hypothetical protein
MAMVVIILMAAELVPFALLGCKLIIKYLVKKPTG